MINWKRAIRKTVATFIGALGAGLCVVGGILLENNTGPAAYFITSGICVIGLGIFLHTNHTDFTDVEDQYVNR